MNTGTLINKAAIATTIVNGNTALFPPEKAKQFFKQTMESNDFLKKMRWEVKKAMEGTIPLLGIGEELLREQVEGTDTITGNEVNPILGEVQYKIKRMKIGTAITEEWFEENIENENFENEFMGMMSQQAGNDLLNLSFNGDESSLSPFYKLNDGFIKLMQDGGNVINAATLYNGLYSDEYFYDMVDALNDKYFNPNFTWLTSKKMDNRFKRMLRNRQTTAGDMALIGGGKLSPLDIPTTVIPKFPDNTILLTDPKNLMIVYSYYLKMRKTTEGSRAINEDKRFYSLKLSADFVILDKDACVLLYNGGQLAV